MGAMRRRRPSRPPAPAGIRLLRQEKVDLLAGTFSSTDRNAAGPVVKAADNRARARSKFSIRATGSVSSTPISRPVTRLPMWVTNRRYIPQSKFVSFGGG